MSQSIMCKLVCSFLIAMSLVDRSAAFTLQRPFAMRQSTVLQSGDAVDKLNLEPIAKIAGEVGSLVAKFISTTSTVQCKFLKLFISF